MMKLSKAAFFLAFLKVATAQNPNTVAKIVGGDQSEPREFPYFVFMGPCGGSLVAPDTVLTAAHCGDFQGKQIIISSYEYNTLSEGAQARFCDVWIPDPLSEDSPVPNYDFALCKLDKPVTISTASVTLKLNEDELVPSEGTQLVVMGLGSLAYIPRSPKIFDDDDDDDDDDDYHDDDDDDDDVYPWYLHDVTVPAVSNADCENIYPGLFTEAMLCAGSPYKDSCLGDSGGPIVMRTPNADGTFVDTQVGLVSWGKECGLPNYPGVYARVSTRASWIKSTICDTFNSVAPFCNNSPPPSECDSGLHLIVKVNTDGYADETTFLLTDRSTGDIIMNREYLVNHHQNELEVCLQSNTCYDWSLLDDWGDGIGGGSYELVLNRETIFSGDGNFGGSVTGDFCTHFKGEQPEIGTFELHPIGYGSDEEGDPKLGAIGENEDGSKLKLTIHVEGKFQNGGKDNIVIELFTNVPHGSECLCGDKLDGIEPEFDLVDKTEFSSLLFTQDGDVMKVEIEVPYDSAAWTAMNSYNPKIGIFDACARISYKHDDLYDGSGDDESGDNTCDLYKLNYVSFVDTHFSVEFDKEGKFQTFKKESIRVVAPYISMNDEDQTSSVTLEAFLCGPNGSGDPDRAYKIGQDFAICVRPVAEAISTAENEGGYVAVAGFESVKCADSLVVTNGQGKEGLTDVTTELDNYIWITDEGAVENAGTHAAAFTTVVTPEIFYGSSETGGVLHDFSCEGLAILGYSEPEQRRLTTSFSTNGGDRLRHLQESGNKRETKISFGTKVLVSREDEDVDSIFGDLAAPAADTGAVSSTSIATAAGALAVAALV